MKKKISLLLAILMLVTLIPTAFAESKTVDAVKNTKKVTLDGEEVMVGAYDVEGYNYLKLRDVAAILNGKKCQFSVGYDEPTKLISVELAKAYEKVEGDLAEIKDEKAKAIVSVKKILVNGEEKEVKTALINEYNYMQLRDLGALVGLNVGYDEVNKVIMLKSDAEAKEEAPRYVMIKSKLYKDTGEINKNMTCGTMDGKILTTVDAKEMPKKDNESNFGTGYEYQIGGEDGSITVQIDDKCLIFKEVKEEEKTEDKKDDKKDEKKEDAKSLDFTDAETAYFNDSIALHDSWLEYLETHSADEVPEESKSSANYYSYLKTVFEAGGRPLSREYKAAISVEERKDGRYTVIKYEYPSGSALLEEAVIEPGTDRAYKVVKSNVEIINAFIIPFRKDVKKDLTNNSELLKTKFKEFYDEAMKKNYKKAAAALYDIGYDANEENVKELIELRAQNAKALKGALGIDNYKYETKKEDNIFMSTFSNGNEMFVMMYVSELDGLLTNYFK